MLTDRYLVKHLIHCSECQRGQHEEILEDQRIGQGSM